MNGCENSVIFLQIFGLKTRASDNVCLILIQVHDLIGQHSSEVSEEKLSRIESVSIYLRISVEWNNKGTKRLM